MILIFGTVMLLAWMLGAKERRLRKAIEEANNPNWRAVHGKGRWADNTQLQAAGMFRRGGLFFGHSPDGKRKLRYQGSGHALVVAAARTGKFLTLVAGLILDLDRRYSLLLVDPKAEMTCVVAKQRSRFGPVYVFNPYGIQLNYLKDTVRASYNPFDDIDPKVTCEADMRALMKTFWTSSADHHEPHWIPNGFNLTAGIAVALKQLGVPEDQNLPMVRSILATCPYKFCRYAVKHGSKFVVESLARFACRSAEKNKELDGFISVALTETAWFCDPAIAESLMKSHFSMRDAKRKRGMTISQVLPVNRLDDGKLAGLFAGWFMHCCLDEGQKGSSVRCVVVIDEMSLIGYSKAWADAFALGAGAAGVQIVAIYQDAAQIMNQFGKVWSTVVQNCGLTCWFGCRDTETQKIVSALAGPTEIVTRSRNISYEGTSGFPKVTDSLSQASRNLIHPTETGQIGEDRMIVFAEGVRDPIMAVRKPYTKLFNTYGRNPYYKLGGLWGWLFD